MASPQNNECDSKTVGLNGSDMSSAAMEQKMWDCYNYLLMCSDVNRIRKILTRTELFRMAMDVPGDVVECGVFKGAGFMQLLKLMKIFAPGSIKRVIGFDIFESMPILEDKEQQKEMEYLYTVTKFSGTSTEYLTKLGKAIIDDINLFEFVKGDICVTAKQYVDNNPGFRISFLYMDLDVADPTLKALEALWPRVTRGGIVVFDEYAIPKWSESQAVDQFFADKPEVVIKTIPWAHTPTAYCIKP